MKKGLIIILIIALMPIISAETLPGNNVSLPTSFGEALDKEVPIPESVKLIAKIVLGVQQSPTITFSLIIILACIWIMLFLIIANVLELMPFFNKTTKWIGAACVTLIIALTGVIESTGLSLITLGRDIIFFEQWSAGALLFAFLVVLISGLILERTLHWVKEYKELSEAHMKGLKGAVNDAYTEERRKGLLKSK